MEQLSDFLIHFFSKRNLSSPNGSMIYTYQMNKSEYDSLRNLLSTCCQKFKLSELFKDKDFSRCFFLYASEWWKREYDGGAWAWDPIIAGISTEQISNHTVELRTRSIICALKYWKYNITISTGKKYLGAIVANGGIPSKFLQTGNKNSGIIRTLNSVLKFSVENNTNRNELFVYVKSIIKRLPESLRKEEICELITNLIFTIIKLKEDYKLQDEKHPIWTLNQKNPKWKDQFPLLLEDESVEKLLNGFVEKASRTSKINIKGKIPSVERIIDLGSSDSLVFDFNFPEFNVDGLYFSKFFGIPKDEILPQTFYINNLDEKNTTIAIATLIIGSSNKYKIKKFNNRINIQDPITLFLASADNKINSNKIYLSEPLDIENPLVFIKNEEGKLILKNSGSSMIQEKECFIAYNQEKWNFENYTTYEQDIKIDNTILALAKCTQDIEINDFHLKLNAIQAFNYKYVLQGDILPYKSYPYVAYKGIPKIIYYTTNGDSYEVPGKYINYFYKNTERTISDINDFSGILDIYCNHNNINKKFSAIIFPKQASINFESDRIGEGSITFQNCNFIKSEPTIDSNIQHTIISKDTHKFHCDLHIPDNICFKLYWMVGGTSLLRLPYPSQGVAFYDEHELCINSQNISLSHLLGKKLRILDNNTDKDNYTLQIKLFNKHDYDNRTIFSRHLFIRDTITEFKLIDFSSNINSLLSYSKEKDDYIRFSIIKDNKEMNYVNISRYDTSLTLENKKLSIPNDKIYMYTNEDLFNTNLYAINLFDEEATKIKLFQDSSEATCCGIWNISDLDIDNNIYIVFSDKKSAISVMPIAIYNENSYEKLSTFNQYIIKKDEDTILKMVQEDLKKYNSDKWENINILANIFLENDISLNSIKLWQILCNDENIFCHFLFYCKSDKSFFQKIKDELFVIPSLIHLETWKDALIDYLEYMENSFSQIDDIGDDLLCQFTNNKIINVIDIFPEVETTIYYLLFKIWIKNKSKLINIDYIVPHISKINSNVQELHNEIFTKQHFNAMGQLDEISLVQMLQMQNSLSSADNWIYIPFDNIYNKIENHFSNNVNKNKQYLFSLDKYCDFIKNVVNFPQLCAIYSFENIKVDDITKCIKLSVKDFINFNENYFIEVYKIAITILCLLNENQGYQNDENK